MQTKKIDNEMNNNNNQQCTETDNKLHLTIKTVFLTQYQCWLGHRITARVPLLKASLSPSQHECPNTYSMVHSWCFTSKSKYLCW